MYKEKLLSKHYIGTLVTKTPDLLFDGKSCQKFVNNYLKKLNVNALGDQLHIFPNSSFTLLVALAESHISIHTWPERHTVQLDVFLCNYQHDNSEKCSMIYQEIIKYFKPVEEDTTVIDRP